MVKLYDIPLFKSMVVEEFDFNYVHHECQVELVDSVV